MLTLELMSPEKRGRAGGSGDHRGESFFLICYFLRLKRKSKEDAPAN